MIQFSNQKTVDGMLLSIWYKYLKRINFETLKNFECTLTALLKLELTTFKSFYSTKVQTTFNFAH